MLCSRFKQILNTKTTTNNIIQCRCLLLPRLISVKCRRDSFMTSVFRNKTDVLSMSSIRFLLKDLRIYRFWSIWMRNVNVGSVVRRCRKDRSVKEVFQSFRQTFLRTPKSVLISAIAALNIEEEDDDDLPPCEKNITDHDLQILLTDLETIQELTKRTLYCERCNLRLTIENKKMPGVKYCTCKEPLVPDPPEDGWVPYMEAEDVIIWRKEYKPGQGLFAYKVYGRYKDVTAQDFAAIQVDGGYRKVWDTAVAALSIVERSANGVMDQAVLHWEVLWPRLFANRDYVYIRRHKEFDLLGMTLTPVSGSGALPQPDMASQTSTPLDQKHNSSDQNVVLSDQKTSVSGQKPATLDQKQNTSDQNLVIKDQNQSASHQNPESFEKEIEHTTDSHGTKITIIRKKRQKPDEKTTSFAEIHPTDKSDSLGDKTTSGDKQSGDKPSGDKPSGDKPSGDKPSSDNPTPKIPTEVERPSVHSNAKRKAQESYESEKNEESKVNKAYVIISRSCTHPDVPHSKNAIRVTEYWSNMVIRTLEGAEQAGMEFVLTYYDEPAVGGLPTAVSSFATGRAAPAFLARMRVAAKEYADFIERRGSVDVPEFKTRPTKISYEEQEVVNEEDMESSKHGPELNGYKPEPTKTSEQGTQTEASDELSDREKLLNEVSYKRQEKQEEVEESDKADSDEQELSWWRQLYPFYYFAS